MGSNILWIIWAWHDRAYALIALQLGLFALNVRGASKNEPSVKDEHSMPNPCVEQTNHGGPG